MKFSNNDNWVDLTTTDFIIKKNILVGDDCRISDVDNANTICLNGNQDSNTAYIKFGVNDSRFLGKTGSGDLTWNNKSIITAAGGTINGDLVLDNGNRDGSSLVFASTGYPTIQIDNYNGNLRFLRDSGRSVLFIGTDDNLYHDNGSGLKKVWTENNLGISASNLANTAVYRNGSGNFSVQDIVMDGWLYTNTIHSNVGNKELLWSDGTYLSLGYGTDYTRTYKNFYLNNASSDSPSLTFYSGGYNAWEMDVWNGRFRLAVGQAADTTYSEKLVFTPYSTTANESYKFIVPSVYNNIGSSGAIQVVVDGDGGIRRSASSIRYKTNVQDIEKQYVDTFFEKARPIYYQDKYPSKDIENWGFWGFIAEELSEFDKRLVHYRWDGEEQEVIETKLDHPAEPERIDIIKEEIILEDGTKEVKETEVVIPAKEATYKEIKSTRFVEDRTKPMIPEGVLYDRITVLLTAKVQEQQKEIQNMKTEISELKDIINKLIEAKQ